jgi:cytochrome c-type biogenesis protein CcsB
VATGATTGAWGLLTGVLLARGLEAGHWPLANRYEFALCFVWAILAIYLLLEVTWGERWSGAFALAMSLLVATYALTRPADVRATAPLLPVLRSVWLQVHVITAVLAYGAFGVAAGLSLLRLSGRPFSSRDALLRKMIERAIERIVALGFPWLTLSILTGAIWAQKAWGRYWGWDPKETWALIEWLWYLLVLHLLPRRRWRGRRLATLVLAGFGIVLFAFVGLPWLAQVIRLETLHGF